MAEKKSRSAGSLRKELAEVDSELMRLLARRSELFDKHLQERRAKHQSLSDPEMEKGLWQVWQRESRGSGLDERLLRRAFHLLNGLARLSAWYTKLLLGTGIERPFVTWRE